MHDKFFWSFSLIVTYNIELVSWLQISSSKEYSMDSLYFINTVIRTSIIAWFIHIHVHTTNDGNTPLDVI